MEWAEKDSLVEERDFRLFNFGQIQSEVLSSRIGEHVSYAEPSTFSPLQSRGEPGRIINFVYKGPATWTSKKLISDDDWTRWLDEMDTHTHQSELNEITLLYDPWPESPTWWCRCVFIDTQCGRLGGRQALRIRGSEVKCLPFSKNTFRRIIPAFRIHRSIARSITRNTTSSFTFVRVNDSSYNCERLVYNCRSSSEWANDLGLSVTYSLGNMSTRAVLYGCCEKARQKFVERLEHSHFAAYHPLLLPTIFAEYERQRHFDLVWPLTQKLVCRVEALDIADDETAEPTDLSGLPEAEEEPEAYVQQWLQISWLRNGLENWKQELDKMIAHSDALREMKLYNRPPTKDVGNSTESTPINASFSDDAFQVESPGCNTPDEVHKLEDAGRRIHQRLLELRGEYDEHIRTCATVIEGMALAAHLEWNKVGREDALTNRKISQSSVEIAEATRRDGERVRSIAILTMVFLPATFVATVFSMTFFNWTPGEGEMVLSPYIWIYAVGTAIFTCLTLGSWYCYGRHRQRHWKQDADSSHNSQERNDSSVEIVDKDSQCDGYVEQVENRKTGDDKGE